MKNIIDRIFKFLNGLGGLLNCLAFNGLDGSTGCLSRIGKKDYSFLTSQKRTMQLSPQLVCAFHNSLGGIKENAAILIVDSLEQFIAFSNKFARELNVLYQ